MKRLVLFGLWAISLLACDDHSHDSGNLTVSVEPESTITDGLAAGDTLPTIRDGWNVSFDKYIAVLGNLRLRHTTEGDDHDHDHGHENGDSDTNIELDETYAVDLRQVPTSGSVLWSLSGLRTGNWEFYYDVAKGSETTMADPTVDDSDLARVQDEHLSYWISGTISKSDGVSCPPPDQVQPGEATPSGSMHGVDCYDNPSISFEIALELPTVYGPCEIDNLPGFNIAPDATQNVAISIHGDHIFFNGFPEGGESGVRRLAQWVADSDLNLDGVVEQSELQAIAPADLAAINEDYSLGGSPISPLDSMWDYVRAQLKTQGHYQGEGECPIDGVAHEHDHDH